MHRLGCRKQILGGHPPGERPTVPRDPLQPQRCARLLAALAAPERLKVVRLLADGPRNVTEITEVVGIPALNISHHLKVLKHAALIRGKKQGRFILYSLSPGVLEQAVAAGVPKAALNLGCCRFEMPLADCPTSSEPDAQ
jgi:DNA-binding transcriptional ArsR family regulator